MNTGHALDPTVAPLVGREEIQEIEWIAKAMSGTIYREHAVGAG